MIKTPKSTKQISKLNFMFIISLNFTKFMSKVDILLYFMPVKFGTVSLNRNLKFGFNLEAGIKICEVTKVPFLLMKY